MELLEKEQIITSLNSTESDSLFISPLLDLKQIGETSIDLRLGYDFLVSVLTRKPYINLQSVDEDYRDISTYFQTTRREIGDRFILYPNQIALTTTLEYVSLPNNMYADILTRSSFTRLGIHVNTMIQPGFRGCFSVELFNYGNNAVELIVGSRMFQIRLFSINVSRSYGSISNRKYIGNVRPTPSKANEDIDLLVLDKIENY